MGHRKAFDVIILCLLMAICANGVVVEACLCGQACRHRLQYKLEARASSSFHLRCCGTNCNSCNIEKGQTLKAANIWRPTGNVKNFDTTAIIFLLVDYPSTIHILKDFGAFYAYKIVTSLPIYLQNLPLLC